MGEESSVAMVMVIVVVPGVGFFLGENVVDEETGSLERSSFAATPTPGRGGRRLFLHDLLTSLDLSAATATTGGGGGG